MFDKWQDALVQVRSRGKTRENEREPREDEREREEAEQWAGQWIDRLSMHACILSIRCALFPPVFARPILPHSFASLFVSLLVLSSSLNTFKIIYALAS